MRSGCFLSALVLALAFFPPAHAQVQIDASKVTCDQFVHAKVGTPRVVGAWLSGFYHGRKDSPLLDTQDFEANLNKLEQFCYQEKNFTMPVMRAIEQVLGPGK